MKRKKKKKQERKKKIQVQISIHLSLKITCHGCGYIQASLGNVSDSLSWRSKAAFGPSSAFNNLSPLEVLGTHVPISVVQAVHTFSTSHRWQGPRESIRILCTPSDSLLFPCCHLNSRECTPAMCYHAEDRWPKNPLNLQVMATLMEQQIP